jgi:transposase-like protein
MKSFLEAIKFFSDEAKCVEFIAQMKWEDGKPACPKCGSMNVVGLKTRPVYQCKEQKCKKQFSVKVGTIFENCNVPLSKFLPCMWLVANCKNGISSCEVGRHLNVSQHSAWFMLHRCREAMSTGVFKKLSGKIEADETYVGGKEKFKHRNHIPSSFWVHGHQGKTAVLGILERGGEVRTTVIDNAKRKSIEPHILENVEQGSTLFTDQLLSYVNIAKEHGYEHHSVNHLDKYVDGEIHTNGLENFWCLFKRAIKGTYTQVAPFHVDSYANEQAFRYNNRKTDDFGRFTQAMSQIFGKRLTYAELTTR